MTVAHIVAVRDALTDLVVDKLDIGAGANGTLEFQTSGFVEVATLGFTAKATGAFDSSGAAGGNADGVALANAISSDTNATGGTVAWAIWKDCNGAEVLRCSVTAVGGGGDIELSSVVIGAGATVAMVSLTYASSV